MTHRLTRDRGLSEAMSEAAHLCEAGRPARQAGTVEAVSHDLHAALTASFLEHPEELTCDTFARELPALESSRRELLFGSVNDRGFGLMPLHECRSAVFLREITRSLGSC